MKRSRLGTSVSKLLQEMALSIPLLYLGVVKGFSTFMPDSSDGKKAVRLSHLNPHQLTSLNQRHRVLLSVWLGRTKLIKILQEY